MRSLICLHNSFLVLFLIENVLPVISQGICLGGWIDTDLYGPAPHTNNTRFKYMNLPEGTPSTPPPTKKACDYGALPGFFDTEAPPGSKWKIIGPARCRLRDLLTQHMNTTCPSPSTRPPVLMFLGDSTDREVTIIYQCTGKQHINISECMCFLRNEILCMQSIKMPLLWHGS